MTECTGSYPLMNIAAEFGVDYADVLIAAQGYAAILTRAGMSDGRWNAAGKALDRMDASIQTAASDAQAAIDRWYGLGVAMMDHARARWAAKAPADVGSANLTRDA